MKEFSKELAEDRRFEIGGEVLTWRYPYWEELAAIFDEDQTTLSNGGSTEITTQQDIDLAIKRIKIFLISADRPRWEALAQREDEAVPLFQIRGLYRWLLEVTSGLPTRQPLASEPGAGKTEDSSPAESPSTEETPAE